jgi:hypothetical protein
MTLRDVMDALTAMDIAREVSALEREERKRLADMCRCVAYAANRANEPRSGVLAELFSGRRAP